LAYNFLQNGTNKFDYALVGDTSASIRHNIVTFDNAASGSVGVYAYDDNIKVSNNTFLSASGTAAAIDFIAAVKGNRLIENNYIEGFDGTGGTGIDFQSQSEGGCINRNNAHHNAGETDKGDMLLIDEDNETSLAASAIAKSGANTFANRYTYFAPLAAIQGEAYPTAARRDIGAVQHADPAGGGGGSCCIIGG